MKHVMLQRTGNGVVVVSWYLYLHRLYCRVSVWRSGITFLYAPCISAYGGVKFGGQAGSSDVSLCTVHFCLLTVESSSEVRQGVLTFICGPCIFAYGGVKFGGQTRS